MTAGFPDLGDWHPTRRSLHGWCKVLSAVRGALTEAHPRWWHISLRVIESGLSTGPMRTAATPGGLELALDLARQRVRVLGAGTETASLPLEGRLSAGRLGGWLLERLEIDHGLRAETDRGKWQDETEHGYDPDAAERYHRAAATAARTLGGFRAALARQCGPVQLWAHHFDLSFELFGDRLIESEGGQQPAQIGFGFFPGDDAGPEAYFYGTPWPFEDRLMETPLPAPAAWQNQPWKGARLPYAAVVENGALLTEFLGAVHAAGMSVLA